MKTLAAALLACLAATAALSDAAAAIPLLAPILESATTTGNGSCQPLGIVSPIAGGAGNIASADLDGDGRPDVVTADFLTDCVTVRLNTGAGTFGPIQRYQVGTKPSFLAIADFDSDGDLDLAVSNAGSFDVSVLLNRGNGTFAPAVRYPVSQPAAGLSGGSFSVVAVDADEDGRIDLVTTNSLSNDVSFLRGLGDGRFAPATTDAIVGPHSVGILPFALSAQDLDGDGHLDLVAGGATSITILLGDGHGHFHAASSGLVGVDIACTQVADLDGDGIPDIAATGTGTGNVQIFLGRGDGRFTRGDTLSSLGVGPQCFSIADLDGDHRPDLALVNAGSVYGVGNLAILRGTGGGHFAGTVAGSTYPIGFAPWATQVRDFDGDGILDIVTANTVPASFSLLLGNGDGTFRPAVTFGI